MVAGITQISSAAAFPLWSLQKQNGWVKRREKTMKGITGISMAYWCFHLRQGS